MSNPVGDADEVVEMARVLRREAGRIIDVHDESVRRLARTGWSGRRAARSKQRLDGSASAARETSAELRSVARALEEHAEWIRITINELRDLERRIRWWAAQHPPDPSTPGPDASWIVRWPQDCSFEWRTLARNLWNAGAYF